jgi:hypothetical protein
MVDNGEATESAYVFIPVYSLESEKSFSALFRLLIVLYGLPTDEHGESSKVVSRNYVL